MAGSYHLILDGYCLRTHTQDYYPEVPPFMLREEVELEGGHYWDYLGILSSGQKAYAVSRDGDTHIGVVIEWSPNNYSLYYLDGNIIRYGGLPVVR